VAILSNPRVILVSYSWNHFWIVLIEGQIHGFIIDFTSLLML